MDPKEFNHCHFVLDHRFNGHHAYYSSFVKTSLYKNIFLFCTHPPGQLSTDKFLINLRHFHRYYFPLEVFINFFICFFFFLFTSRANCVVHVHGVANVAPLLASRLLRFKTIWYLHECNKSFCSLFDFAFYFPFIISPIVVVVSKQISSTYSVSDFFHIPGSIDTSFWTPCNSFHNDSLPVNFLTIANLNPDKGIHLLLDSLAAVDIPISLQIAGSPLKTHHQYYVSLRAQVALINKQTHHHVELLGFLSPFQLLDAFERTQFFILPSLTEAHPISLLQALSCGIPSIVTNTGSCSEILPACLHSFLIPPNDIKSLSHSIFSLSCVSRHQYSTLSKHSRQVIVDNYSNHRFSELLSNLYLLL